jgi:hypothetical protein
VTWVPTLGDVVDEGALFARIDDRPVIALKGELPMYRDLTLGVSGRDVEQLEQALDRLGFDSGPIDGVFDASTQNALSELYASHGATLLGPTVDDFDRAAQVAAAADARQIEVLGQQSAVVAAEAEVVATRSTLATAEQALADRVADRNNIEGPLDRAIANANAAHFLAIDARDANDDLDKNAEFDNAVRQRLLEFEAATEARRIAIEEADRAIATARIERDAAALAVDAARAGLADAAGLRLSLVERAAQETRAGESAQSSLHPYVPADEIVFLPDYPVRVSSSESRIGAPIGEILSTVTNAVAAIDASLALNEADLVSVGNSVIIDEPNLGITEAGVVSRVDDVPGTMGVDGFHVYMEVIVDGSPARVVGSSVRLRLPVESSQGEVKAIPVSALSLAADGSSRVEVKRGSDFEFAEVQVGLTADGYVELTEAGGLEPGDLVVVGFDRPAPSQSGQS